MEEIQEPIEEAEAEADDSYGPEEHEEDAGVDLAEMTIPCLGNLQRSASIAKLTAAVARACQEFEEIKKESENPFFKNSASGGKYADLAALIGATRSQLGKQGVVVWQWPGVQAKTAGVTTLISHTSGEWMQGDLPLPILKHDPHGIASCLTYSRRYSYAPALNLAAEDDDGNSAMASRKEHLEKLTQQMAGQERITPVQVKAFLDSAIKTGKTKEQIEKYLDQLNGLRQVEEITKGFWNDAIKWAVTRPAEPASQQKDLLPELEKSVDFAKLNRELRAALVQHAVSSSDMHQYIKETFKADSVKDLSAEELRKTIHWVDEQ